MSESDDEYSSDVLSFSDKENEKASNVVSSEKEKIKKRFKSGNRRKKEKKASVPTVVNMWAECSSSENAKKYFIEKKVLSERSKCEKEICQYPLVAEMCFRRGVTF